MARGRSQGQGGRVREDPNGVRVFRSGDHGVLRQFRPENRGALRLLPAQSETRCVAIPLLAPQRGGCDRRMISGGRAMTDLFDAAKPAAPLADALRPKTLDEVVGQSHLL